MNADQLIVLLKQLTPEQRRWPLVGYDKFDGFGEIVKVRPAELANKHDTRRPCLFLVTRELTTEWIA